LACFPDARLSAASFADVRAFSFVVLSDALFFSVPCCFRLASFADCANGFRFWLAPPCFADNCDFPGIPGPRFPPLDFCPLFETFSEEPCLAFPSVEDLDEPVRRSPCEFDSDEAWLLADDFPSPVPLEGLPSFVPVDSAAPDTFFPDPD
jgi:hypothetical protein